MYSYYYSNRDIFLIILVFSLIYIYVADVMPTIPTELR